jgi:hypothetical protein
MKPQFPILVAALGAFLGGHAVSRAEDDPAKPAPAEEKPAAPPAKPAADPAAEAESDKKAREILAKAAERQNAGDLVEPGKLESFHVVFHVATIERTTTNKEGQEVKTLIELDDDGLVVDWLKGSIKTTITFEGATTTKARYLPMETAWISDGTTVSALTGDRKADFEQLELHRRVIDQLLDVAFLGKLAAGKARWRVLADATVPGAVAIERLPPAETPNALRITLWIARGADGAVGDVVQAAMPSTEDKDTSFVYRFGYHVDFPKVSRKDAETKMRFPYSIDVEERRGAEKPRPMLALKVDSVSLNSVVELDFARPKPKAKPPK